MIANSLRLKFTHYSSNLRIPKFYSTDPMSYFHSRVRLSFKRGKKRKISGIDKHLQQKFSDMESFFFPPKLDWSNNKKNNWQNLFHSIVSQVFLNIFPITFFITFFLKVATTMVDLLFIELMSYLSQVKQMYSQSIHITHELILCV